MADTVKMNATNFSSYGPQLGGKLVFFQRLYQAELLIEPLVDIVRLLKASGTGNDSKVFNSMLHILFDEYRILRKYPDLELKITGIMFL